VSVVFCKRVPCFGWELQKKILPSDITYGKKEKRYLGITPQRNDRLACISCGGLGCGICLGTQMAPQFIGVAPVV
jgi:hypothetical protein